MLSELRVDLLTDRLCGNQLWGPWKHGVLTLCFQETVFSITLFSILLVCGTRRLLKLRQLPHYSLPNTKLYLLKLALVSTLSALVLFRSLIHLALGTPYLYEFLADCLLCMAWSYSGLLFAIEYSRALPHNWVLRLWWLLLYLCGSVKLQSIVVDIRMHGMQWEFVLFFIQYPLTAMLAILGLWFNRVPTLDSTSTHYVSVSVDDALEDSPDKETTSGLGQQPCPEPSANIVSKFFYWWFNPLLYYGFDHPLDEPDLWELAQTDNGRINAVRFEKAWNHEKAKSRNVTVARVLLRAFGLYFAAAGVLKIANDLLLFLGPIFLNRIVNFMENEDEPLWHGAGYAFGMFFSSLCTSLVVQHYFFMGFRSGMHIRAALVTAIYRKAFRMSNVSRQGSTVGEIVNHMALDAQRLADLMPYLHMVWSAPLQIVVSLVMLWRIVGPATLAGVGVMLLLIPVNLKLARYLGSIQKDMMKNKDERNKIVNEVLQGIRVIKFFAWEMSFMQQVINVRNTELKTLRKSAYLRAFTIFLWIATPLFVSISTFAAFSLAGNTLTAETAFTALALFNILRFPLNMLPTVISALVEANVSAKRLDEYLGSPELDPRSVNRAPSLTNKEDKPISICIQEGEFKWDPQAATPTLSDINLKIKPGSLVAVVGSVGSGKSALLSALLGEITKTKGEVTVAGSTALVTQQAWIQNASLKDNIIFGDTYDESKYQEVLDVCELRQDIAMLPGGDLTEIGEKGINLSGGQKQRISIARAVYSDRDIYLLDDPLSAVDAHVGRNIFENCIMGTLDAKTRVLVTHQLQFLSQVDLIVVLKKGKIVETGTYNELMDTSKEFAKLIHTHVREDEHSTKQKQKERAEKQKVGESKPETTKAVENVPPKMDKLISTEERDTGSVSVDVYKQYILAIGGLLVSLTILAVYACEQGTRISSDWWLSYWSSAEDASHRVSFYLGIYALWGFINTCFVLTRAILTAYAGLRSAKTLHERLLYRVLRAPMSFFDTTPIGRILNRFSKDIYSIDENLPRVLSSSLGTIFNTIGIIIVICTVTPFFICTIIPLAFVYHHIQQYYIRSSREMKRLESNTRSPIYAHFSETLSGLSVIRSYKKEEQFASQNEDKLDRNMRTSFPSMVSNRWLGVRLEIIGTTVVSVAALFAVLERGNIDPGLAGLSITYALSITSTLNWLVRMSTEVETELVSVERVIQYLSIDTEAPALIAETEPPQEWPQHGAIEIRDLKLRYRPGLGLVLRGITCSIQPKEKIGVVGRTGAGKSSLMLALFRLVEPAGGSIVIDGIDITAIGLDTLRSRLSIIPQDPTLFTGTIRTNLDPFGNYSDEELWDALRKVHLAEAVTNMVSQLDAPVAEYGENLSVGQRQLMCLARAILRRAKVLVMDEATAAVDFETDSLIQQTIREEFANVTVLTIAHRIHTILDYDRVLVLDAGCIAEFGPPSVLSEDKHSIFHSMMRAGGGNSTSQPTSTHAIE